MFEFERVRRLNLRCAGHRSVRLRGVQDTAESNFTNDLKSSAVSRTPQSAEHRDVHSHTAVSQVENIAGLWLSLKVKIMGSSVKGEYMTHMSWMKNVEVKKMSVR